MLLSIDVGGTSAKYAFIDIKGNIYNKDSFLTGKEMTPTHFFDEISKITKTNKDKITGIGICTPGFVDSDNGIILSGVENIPFLYNVQLKAELLRRFPNFKIAIQNDAKAAALGEFYYGNAKNSKSCFCTTLGTGIGGAYIIDGNIVQGSHFRLGEIGYSNYKNKDEYLENSFSTISVMNRTAQLLNKNTLDGKYFFELLRENDNIVCKEFEKWTDVLSTIYANIIILLDIDKLIIGGGVCKQEVLINTLRKKILSKIPDEFRDEIDILPALLGNDAALLGNASILF